MHWGKHKENGIWFAKKSSWKLLGPTACGRLVYVALGRFRLRLMNPFNTSS